MRTTLLMTALLLAGCASRPASAPTPSAPVPSASATAAASAPVHVTLASEQKRLAALFRDTPAVFVMQPDGSLRSAVPLRYCFERGSSVVKPALAAVVDRLAKSQLQEASRFRVAAPPDPGTKPDTKLDTKETPLLRDRVAAVRDRLVSQGIAASRITLGGAAQVEGVEVFVTDAASP
jgi:outer membrane protein OmpA-like peptidoglycan-associated protein